MSVCVLRAFSCVRVCVCMVLGDQRGRRDGLLCEEVERGWKGGRGGRLRWLVGSGTQFEKGKAGGRAGGRERGREDGRAR